MSMQTGNAPWMTGLHRRTIPAPKNPMDKSTVVSILPKVIHEFKHTIEPGEFVIEKGSLEKPSLLVVGSSSWWREIDEDQPMLEIPQSSIQVADSIVKDYSNGILGCNMGDAMPGLFYLPGEISLKKLQEDYKPQLAIASGKQSNWYKILVKMADVLWARSNGNPLSISDDMRLAAQELQLKDKAWMGDFNTLELKNCPACGFLRNGSFPVCANCKTVLDVEQFKKLGLQVAV